ncbi:TetR/AcrR family transcriptional regulator [Mycolicibacterium hodleri]|uniref:TetR/AcrR family transcriptional regulator n=1 Tax=Mycolicibacterium hodleri TaxID=49897 RepID=A0A502EH52_9MYCO|nr:TetR/AcrR family transcriptional regulator [Mycolicibacterium hodleri]TPG35830.1 TetR/AcrR family transcriptional regulator [Mycolicibacterium hodleri]
MNVSKRLSPGRHQLSRDEVRNNQRNRIFGALETVMSAKGYSDTSVADIIKSAGVSRQTFYELFCSKQDCFLASFGRRQAAVIEAMREAVWTGSPMDRFGSLLRTYLAIMASDQDLSRTHLIGVYSAGSEAIAKRAQMQQQFVDGVAEVFDARSDQDRFACQALVAAIATLVTHALLADDPQVVLDLYEPLVGVAAKLMAER